VHRIAAVILIPACLFALLSLGGCGGPDEHVPLETPKGWAGNTTYWWQVGADTTGAFRDLESLESMGVEGSHLLTISIDGASPEEMALAQRKFNQYVKESLIELFRNEPEIVDSLFEKYVASRIGVDNLDGDVQPLIKENQRRAYQILSRHFRYPRTITRLGEDIPITVPDSLREQEISGAVFIQIALNKEGVPIALTKLNGVHPVLDRIAMRAMTEMRWQPAFVLRGGSSKPTPSWTRMKVRFGPQG
jgi:hypothetical protein